MWKTIQKRRWRSGALASSAQPSTITPICPGHFSLARPFTCLGTLCAFMISAWFIAPFYVLLLGNPENVTSASTRLLDSWLTLGRAIPALWRRTWPVLATLVLILLPYLLWNAFALYDDVWRWSNGQGETGYQ